MKGNKSFVFGVIVGVIGIVMFSSKAIMVKLAYKYQVDALTVLLFRMLFSFPFYLGVIIFYKTKSNYNHSIIKFDYFTLIIVGVLGYYLSSLFDFIGLTYIKASLERIILFIYPTLVLFFNKLFFKIKLTSAQIFAIILSYLGIVLAFSQEVKLSGTNTYIGGVFILLSAITYALYLVGSGRLIAKFGVVKFTSYVMLVSCISVFIHFIIVHKTTLLGFPWQVYMWGALIAVFATVIPSYLVSWSIKLISASNFAVVAGIGPISTIILATIFLNEKLTILQLIGASTVIFGIVWVTAKTKK